MKRYLLDTNILSEPMRPAPNPQVIALIRRLRAQCAVPAPVWHELIFGCLRMPPSRKRSAIEEYLELGIKNVFEILPYDRGAAGRHAVERARLVAQGRTPQFVDGQIASIAVTQGLTLVTHNTADFAGFDDLQLEDWFEPGFLRK